MASSVTVVPLQASSLHLVKTCETDLSDVLQSKFGCACVLEGLEAERWPSSAQQNGPDLVPQKRFWAVLPSGVTVSVWKNDLTRAGVEAVVNAANDRLQHFGGLALALCRVGGPQIQKESDDYIRKHGHLKTGDAVIGTSGKLPCQHIIHAVGPCLPPRPNPHEVAQAKSLLEKTIRGILTVVKERKVKTVAIPAISSGLFNFPLPTCADAIVATVREFCAKSSKGTLPYEILLMNNDEPSVREMERACREQLTSNMSSSSSSSISSSSSSSSKASTSAAAQAASSLTVQLGPVHLTLKRGRLEEEEVDVIVNTVGADRVMSSGAASKALLMRAGQKMQTDLNCAKLQGSVAVTKGHSLRCKDVFHTFSNWNREGLYKSVQECLFLAVANKRRSISFPAIGTGGHCLPKEEVAGLMSDALENFASKNNKPLEVHFVIFPSDTDTFKAFEDALRSLQQKASPSNFAPAAAAAAAAAEERSRAAAAPPHISLRGPTEQAEEAERWLSQLLGSSGPVRIHNNFIPHFGTEEQRQLEQLSNLRSVHLVEDFHKGHALLTVSGASQSDVIMAALRVEALLCRTQRDFAEEEERAMLPFTSAKVHFERMAVNADLKLFADTAASFRREGLRVVKMESVGNPTQTNAFDAKKKQLRTYKLLKMYQRIPAHFCQMVSHVGFHTEFAPPADPELGEGIYFASSVKVAMEVWKEPRDKYLYLVEAELLVGKSTRGDRGLILPVTGPDSVLYDCAVGGGGEVYVVGSGYQALPKYIITCQREGGRGYP